MHSVQCPTILLLGIGVLKKGKRGEEPLKYFVKAHSHFSILGSVKMMGERFLHTPCFKCHSSYATSGSTLLYNNIGGLPKLLTLLSSHNALKQLMLFLVAQW